MKKVFFALLLSALALAPQFVKAQAVNAIVVATCGTAPYTYPAGQTRPVVQDVNGNICTAASVSASISGFAPGGAYASLTSTAASADVASPAGAVVAAFNTGTSAVSCVLAVGAGTATANKNIIQAGSWFAFTVGSNTHVACINQAGDAASNVVVLSGGTGLPTGAGGGGGSGGGGGAITAASGSFASGALSSGSVASGAMVDLGTIADAAATQGSTGTVSAKLRTVTSQLNTGNTSLASIVTNTGGVAQDSDTAGQTIAPIGCRTLTSAPSDTTAKTHMPSCNLAGAIRTENAPVTTGGLAVAFIQPTASDNHQNITSAASQLYWWLLENNSSTINYLRFYDAGAGFNGCNSATNLKFQVQIPASTSVGGVNVALPFGIPFTSGIAVCISSGYATNDTTNATASAMSISIGTK